MHKKRFLIYPLLAGVVSGTVLPIFAQDGHVSPTAPDNKSDITVVGRMAALSRMFFLQVRMPVMNFRFPV